MISYITILILTLSFCYRNHKGYSNNGNADAQIENSTREERQAYVLDAWKCLHNCELMEQ